MPLMKLACTALERVPLTRPKVIEYLINKFNQDLVFCRAPDDNELTSGIHGMLLLPRSVSSVLLSLSRFLIYCFSFRNRYIESFFL